MILPARLRITPPQTILFCIIIIQSFSHLVVRRGKRWEEEMNVESVPAVFVGTGLYPIQGLKVIKRHVEIPNVKGSGTRKNVQSGTGRIPIILEPTTCKRRSLLPLKPHTNPYHYH
jgi:hypothetical protein